MPIQLKLPDSPLARELTRVLPHAFSLRRGIAVSCAPGLAEGYAMEAGPQGLGIRYAGTDDLLMALGDVLAADRAFTGKKIAPYAFRGIMLDVSRNAVVRPKYLKDMLLRLALMGLNRFCLYTEDVYPVPDEPLFGYARGRYTEAEIRDLVKYGKGIGVTLFPCIQTLGHMEQILKYPHYTPLKDNDMVYNVHAEGLYAFIEKTILAAAKPYDTKFIHVGMDETFGLGRGLSFREGQPIYPHALYVEHVRKVAEICRKHGLQPAMWGDVVLGEAGAEGVGAEEARKLPTDMAMNYWNYAHSDPAKYKKAIGDFRAMGFEPMLSPGVWSWSRFFGAYYKAEENIASLIGTGRALGVRSALNTHWGDDGHECLFDFNLPAHAYFLAECTEADSAAAGKQARRRFAAVFQADMDDLASTQAIDTAGYKSSGLLPFNVGKCFLYDDPAQGLFSGLPFVKPAAKTYQALSAKMARLAAKKTPFQAHYKFAQSFCELLQAKGDLYKRAVALYRGKSQAGLKPLLADIRLSRQRLATLHARYRTLWLAERSAFGLEVIAGRLAAVDARLEHLALLLREHAQGKRARLEELDFKHYSMFHASRSPDYQPSIWPEFMLHYSALASRNAIKWW